MPYAGTAAITELWAKSVLAFGRSLGVSAASTTVDVQLKNNAGTVLSTGVIPAATQSSAGLMTAADKTTLDGLVSGGGEPNQNAWSNFVFGNSTVSANAKTDTFTFIAGANVTFSVNAANKNVTIAATNSTYPVFDGTADGLVGYDSSVVDNDKAVYIGDGMWRYLNMSTAVDGSNPTTDRVLNLGYVGENAEIVPLAQATIPGAQTAVPGLMSTADKAKLDGIAAGAEANQNAFATIAVLSPGKSYGDLSYEATASSESDEYSISLGDQLALQTASSKHWVQFLPDIFYATCDTAAGTAAKVATLSNSAGFALTAGVVVAVTFKYGNSASTPTLNVDSTGAKSIAVAKDATTYQTGNGTTYNSWGAYETVLFTYTGTYWVHLGSSRLGYLAYSGLSSKANTASPTLTGTPKAPTAAAGTNTEQIATTEFVTSAVAAAQVGAASFQGTLSAQSTLTNASYKSGWYWVVGTAGTYAGEACEVGDMVFAVANKGSAYSASDFSVVQNNIVEMTAAEVDAICTL